MKDKKGNIHIFEVKSVNQSNDVNIDAAKYNQKLLELGKAYKQASLLTKHIFYLPVLKEDKWVIRRYMNGKEDMISEKTFEESLRYFASKIVAYMR